MGGAGIGGTLILSALLTVNSAESKAKNPLSFFPGSKPNNILVIKKSPLLDFPEFTSQTSSKKITGTAGGKSRPKVTGGNDTVSVKDNSIFVYYGGKKKELKIDSLEQKFGCARLEDAISEKTEFDNGRQEFYFIMQKGIVMLHKRGIDYQTKDMLFEDGSSFGEKPVYFMLNDGGIFAASETYSIVCAYKHGIRKFSTLGMVETFGPLNNAKIENFYMKEIDQPVIKMFPNGNEAECIYLAYKNNSPAWKVVNIEEYKAGAKGAGEQGKPGKGAGFSQENLIAGWQIASQEEKTLFSSSIVQFSGKDTTISFDELETRFGKPVECKTIPKSLLGVRGRVYVSGNYVVVMPTNVIDLSPYKRFAYSLFSFGPITSAKIGFGIDPQIGAAAYIYNVKGKNWPSGMILAVSLLDENKQTFINHVKKEQKIDI